MTTATSTQPAVLESVDDLNPFDTPAAASVQAANLREGMVLLDPELGTPLYWIDHRVRATPRSGDTSWMVHDLETGCFQALYIGRRTFVSVMAR